MNSVLACSLLKQYVLPLMVPLTEQSVFTSLPLARPQLHILSNSPVAAMAAVARPSANAPASADVTIVLIMVHFLAVAPLSGQEKNAPLRGLFPHLQRPRSCKRLGARLS